MISTTAPVPLPDPTLAQAALWLKTINRDRLHTTEWVKTNQRFHGLALAVRPFITKQYDTPEEQEAAFDGITLALAALSHFRDIDTLSTLLANTPDGAEALPEMILPPPVG